MAGGTAAAAGQASVMVDSSQEERKATPALFAAAVARDEVHSWQALLGVESSAEMAPAVADYYCSADRGVETLVA